MLLACIKTEQKKLRHSHLWAAFLVISFSSDWLFPTAESRKIVNALLKNRKNVSFCEIRSGYGHDAFLLEVETLGRMVRDFLRNRLEVCRG